MFKSNLKIHNTSKQHSRITVTLMQYCCELHQHNYCYSTVIIILNAIIISE